ncbi:unnamed protein product [Oncorhynchus mykiss]|uniref:Uncharacterized protein n=1 Tax=Oncorhynchus mykiss TaxID=8022 RepID=A0A060ZG87_ONCMY|nr:unnamed protein product [Oncorhynchus mykiss]
MSRCQLLTGTVNPIHIIFFNRDREGALTSLSPHTGTLERYSHLEDIKEHAKRWKSRREGRHPEDSSPEIQRPRDKRMEGLLLNRGKSISLDNVSKLSSSGSGSDSSSSITEVLLLYYCSFIHLRYVLLRYSSLVM